MNRKRLILFGTRHYKASDIPSEIRSALVNRIKSAIAVQSHLEIERFTVDKNECRVGEPAFNFQGQLDFISLPGEVGASRTLSGARGC
jgi:hypothetical protein